MKGASGDRLLLGYGESTMYACPAVHAYIVVAFRIKLFVVHAYHRLSICWEQLDLVLAEQGRGMQTCDEDLAARSVCVHVVVCVLAGPSGQRVLHVWQLGCGLLL